MSEAPSSFEATPTPSRTRVSMPQMVLMALAAGVATGVFFGELTTRIKLLGDLYISLLQMMVLPYIIISLIGGIGKLSLAQAKQLAKYAVLVLLVMWLIIGAVLVLLPLALLALCSGLGQLVIESASRLCATVEKGTAPAGRLLGGSLLRASLLTACCHR